MSSPLPKYIYRWRCSICGGIEGPNETSTYFHRCMPGRTPDLEGERRLILLGPWEPIPEPPADSPDSVDSEGAGA